ncbi:DUF6986 family protein [Antrihabitans sp. NCIMB 15449]|uniref:DUF6986 family protein n=1 Tax=Antrihabitans spumae TaxID=3373370 RepID=A0ABW7JVH4_9NOCA
MPPNPDASAPRERIERIGAVLRAVDADLALHYRHDRPEVQPLHTVYVSAADATPETPSEWGRGAGELIADHSELFTALDISGALPEVRDMLARNPIQDLRIDFEDGYGRRPDAVEDHDARRAGATFQALREVAGGPPWCGIRIRGLTTDEFARSLRTLELVLDGAGGVPAGFVFTIPKLRVAEQVTAAVLLCEELEDVHGLPSHTLRFELQIESPQAILGRDGAATVAKAIHLADGRCTALHYGTYDYSAALGIASIQQSLEHPVADHAKAVMLAAAAQTGVWVCDGSTQVNPTGSATAVADAIGRHYRLVTRSLERGYYQGWDMHPGHLATRWLATFAFYRTALHAAAPRLQAYLDKQGGDVVDEPATAQALAKVVLRGIDARAFDEQDLVDLAPCARRDVLDELVGRTR